MLFILMIFSELYYAAKIQKKRLKHHILELRKFFSKSGVANQKKCIFTASNFRRDGRVVEGARLESA